MYRNIELIIYDYAILMNKIKICIDNKFQYAYCLHDKDIDDNDHTKKAHYHLRIFHTDRKTISAWSKVFHVKENEIETLIDKRLSIRYLIHRDNKEKYQYEIENIVSNFDLSSYFLDKKVESDDITTIINYIDSSLIIHMRDIMQFILKNDLWSTYRRNYSIIKDIVLEHNNKLTCLTS